MCLPQQPISPWMFKWVPQPLRWHSPASTAPNQSLRLGTIRPTMVDPVPPVYCRWIQPLFLKGTTSNQTYLHSQAGPWPRVSRWFFIIPEHHRGCFAPPAFNALSYPKKSAQHSSFNASPTRSNSPSCFNSPTRSNSTSCFNSPPDPTLRVVSISDPTLRVVSIPHQIQLPELFQFPRQIQLPELFQSPSCFNLRVVFHCISTVILSGTFKAELYILSQ